MTLRWLRVGAQIVLIGGAVLFLVKTAREHAGTFSTWDGTIDWPALVAASVLVLGAFVLMVLMWSTSLRWWNAALSFLSALRIWSLSNLARFIPGAVWQFAGLAALAADEGISPLAATGAVLLQQLMLLATGVVVAVMMAPGWIQPIAGGLPPVATAIIAIIALAALCLVIPITMPAIGRVLGRMVKREFAWPRPSPAAFAGYTTALVIPWLIYAVAFWLFARAVLGPPAPAFTVAGGAFVASYVAGIVAVFAPAGIAVREAALVALLAPVLDARVALALALGSRLWMIALEIAMAAFVVVLSRARGRPARRAI
ncbi:MAG TPA: lysylphosphatidylglycerol synthase domain-containing protein [Gemmatimonadaceae bacterium]|nr:lysylphosphatidylglycerol synthase domain-containing protein [Gemmatimonadaceae bacterium]